MSNETQDQATVDRCWYCLTVSRDLGLEMTVTERILAAVNKYIDAIVAAKAADCSEGQAPND